MAIPVMDIATNDTTAAAWDFLASHSGEDDSDDSFADSDMDRGEGEEIFEESEDTEDESEDTEDDAGSDALSEEPAASVEPDAIDAAVSEYQGVIAAQQAQLNHLLGILNAPPEESYDDLTPEQKEPYERAAARRNLDPAYLHFHDVERRRAERTYQTRSTVQAVSAYADEHPDAERYGEAFANYLTKSPAARAQLQMIALLPVESIYQAGCEAIDGMYAKIARADSEKRVIAERKAAELAAQQKAQVVERTKRRARGEGGGSASPAGVTTPKRDDAAERIVKSAGSNWYNSLFR